MVNSSGSRSLVFHALKFSNSSVDILHAICDSVNCENYERRVWPPNGNLPRYLKEERYGRSQHRDRIEKSIGYWFRVDVGIKIDTKLTWEIKREKAVYEKWKSAKYDTQRGGKYGFFQGEDRVIRKILIEQELTRKRNDEDNRE